MNLHKLLCVFLKLNLYVFTAVDRLKINPFSLDLHPNIDYIADQVQVCLPLRDFLFNAARILRAADCLQQKNVFFDLLTNLVGGLDCPPFELVGRLVHVLEDLEVVTLPSVVNLGDGLVVLLFFLCLLANLSDFFLMELQLKLEDLR